MLTDEQIKQIVIMQMQDASINGNDWSRQIDSAIRTALRLAEQNAGEQDKGRPADFQSADRGVRLSSPAPNSAPDMPPEPVLHNSVYGPANDVWVKAEDFYEWRRYAFNQSCRADAAEREVARFRSYENTPIDRAMAGEGKEGG